MAGKILMTTGFNFEGFTINQYIGVFSGECALGTGFLSSLGSDFSDVFGTNSKSYSSKLKQAKEYAVEQLQDQTMKAGGNAIIGLSIHYTMFSRDIIGVVANGTAVKIDGNNLKQSNDTVIPIGMYNKNTTFRPISFGGHSLQNKYAFFVELYHDSEEIVSSILTDIKFVTVFENVYELKDVAFTNFSFASQKHLMSDYTTLSVPCENITLLKNVTIVTKKYIQNEELVDISGMDLEQELVTAEYQQMNKPSLAEMEKLNTGKEIYEYLKDYMQKNNQSEPELMEWLEKTMTIERLYGNLKDDVMKYIKDYYQFD